MKEKKEIEGMKPVIPKPSFLPAECRVGSWQGSIKTPLSISYTGYQVWKF